MPTPRERLRQILARHACTPAAPIFDPLSARVAELVGWELCKLTGSVGKAASLAVPDEAPLTNLSDLADACRRITRVMDVPLIVDADDGGGNALVVLRTVRELEAAGASAIEIEDSAPPAGFRKTGQSVLISKEEHIGKLKAAVAARRDPLTVIVARTRALEELPLERVLERVRDYSATGVDAVYLAGYLPRGRADIEAVHAVTDLPLYLLRLPEDAASDPAFLATNRISIRTMEQSVYGVAVKALYDALKHLKDGGDLAALRDRRAPQGLIRSITRAEELSEWESKYVTA